MMAWGIFMTGLTLFGMLALGIAMVSMTDSLPGVSHGEGTAPDFSPGAGSDTIEGAAANAVDVRRAA